MQTNTLIRQCETKAKIDKTYTEHSRKTRVRFRHICKLGGKKKLNFHIVKRIVEAILR